MKNKLKKEKNRQYQKQYLYKQNELGLKPVCCLMSVQMKRIVDDLKRLTPALRQQTEQDFISVLHGKLREFGEAHLTAEWSEDFITSLSSSTDRE